MFIKHEAYQQGEQRHVTHVPKVCKFQESNQGYLLIWKTSWLKNSNLNFFNKPSFKH